MSERQTPGAMIATARKDAGKSASEVARAIGISGAFLSDIEHDKRRPALAKWAAFAEAIPGLILGDFAEALLAAGRIEIDGSAFTDAQRRTLAAWLCAAARRAADARATATKEEASDGK